MFILFDPLHFTGLEPSLAALSNVNPNSYVVRWSDPVALLRYLIRFSGEYLYPGFYDPTSLALMSRVVTLSLICYFKDSIFISYKYYVDS